MAGSIYGKHFRISTWGESHGKGIGVVVDGCPAGLTLTEKDIQSYLDRRKPGQSKYTTGRTEADQVEILSGVFEGKTMGTPISMVIYNISQRSGDYSEIASYYRPGHADYTYDQKYGFRDYRGGGRSSGRETIGRVAAGAVAAKILKELGIELCTYTRSIGTIEIDMEYFSKKEIFKNAFYMPDAHAAEKAGQYLNECMKEKDSSGGIVECVITGVPTGLGEPCFDKLDANLAKAILSIGAVKGFEIGDGSSLIFWAAVKPTPSIAACQHTVNQNGENIKISIHGRHDPVIVPRAVVVVGAMAALTVVDALMDGMSAKMEYIHRIWDV